MTAAEAVRDGGDHRVRSVVILGGGTAGWMTAAALSRTFGKTLAITLLESEEIGTVGVGEATIPTIHWFNELIGLDERAFLSATKATFKLGIEFVDWTRSGHRYFHPFGEFGARLPGVAFHHRWLKARSEGCDLPLAAFSLAGQLAADGRFAKPTGDARSILSTLGYAYHFDATGYARHLRGIAEAAGVARVEGKLADLERDAATGHVAALTTHRGERLEGDLFIDCSGFRALLIDAVMQSPFEDWSEWLPCDRAVAVPCVTGGDALTPFTRSTARSAGWQWRIPLQHRTGNGYVYASRFLSDDEATATLLDNLDGEPLAEPRTLRFTAGTRRRAWVGNVVAIGLSSGFLEPLESTSIHLIQSGIAKLLALFPNRDCDPALSDRYNALLNADMDNIKDFLIFHYHATERTEPFWEERRKMALPETLVGRETQYRQSGRLTLGSEELFREASWLAALNGQGVSAQDYNPLADLIDPATNLAQLRQIADVIARAVPTLPRHEAALAAAMAT